MPTGSLYINGRKRAVILKQGKTMVATVIPRSRPGLTTAGGPQSFMCLVTAGYRIVHAEFTGSSVLLFLAAQPLFKGVSLLYLLTRSQVRIVWFPNIPAIRQHHVVRYNRSYLGCSNPLLIDGREMPFIDGYPVIY